MKNLKFKILNYRRDRGFTLIELVVVMAIFLFVIGAAIGIFIYIVQNQKKVLSEQQLLNQISYVEEYMSKSLRMAKADEEGNCITARYIYLLTNQVSGSYRGIKFFNQSNKVCQQFFLDVASPADSRLILWEKKGNNSPVALTSTNLKINSIRFAINGLDGSVHGQNCDGTPDQCGASMMDVVQPKVTILLNITIDGDSSEPNRIIQTTVSVRNLNVK